MKHRIIQLAFMALISLGTARAQVPVLINYQGRVAVGGVNFDSTTAGHPGQFKFALVNADGTQSFWSNDRSSANGSEPGSAVSLPVTKGLYSVLLGDNSLGATMRTIGAPALAHADVRLRVWFNDGTNGFQLLAPDQRLSPSAYLSSGIVGSSNLADGAVTTTKVAPGAITGSQLATGSVDVSRLTVPSAPIAGQVLGFDGNSFSWVAPGGGGGNGNYWAPNGASIYFNSGNVGVGTSSPATKLEVRTGTGLYGLMHSDGTIKVGSYVGNSSSGATGGWLGTQSNHPLYFYVNGGQPQMTINTLGNVGIGTATPDAGYRLHVVGNTEMNTANGSMLFGSPNAETGISITAGPILFPGRADLRFDGSIVKLLAGAGTGPMPSTNGIAINTSGSVGIGTVSPQSKLHVQTAGVSEATIRSSNERAILSLESNLPGGSTHNLHDGKRC